MKSYTPKEPVVDLAKAEIGRNLVSSNLGDSSVLVDMRFELQSLHKYLMRKAINLSQVVASLLSEYFSFRMQNRLRMNPQNNK